MERVLVLSHGKNAQDVRRALPNSDVVLMDSKEELAHALVNTTDIAMVVCELTPEEPALPALLESIKRSFPRLPVTVIADEKAAVEKRTADLVVAPGELDAEQAAALSAYVADGASPERRHHRRYDWPIAATLYRDGKSYERRRVRALSAGGAYLELDSENLPEGSHWEIEIYFQNFKLATECTVLDQRGASGFLPPGFGIRFENLSLQGQKFIDTVVGDALMEILLDPTAQPDVPAIDDDALELSFTDEFELTE